MILNERCYVINEIDENFVILEDSKTVMKIERIGHFLGKLHSRFYINDELVFETTFHDRLIFIASSVVQIRFQKLNDHLSLSRSRMQYQLHFGNNVVKKTERFYGSPYIEFYLNDQQFGSIYRNKNYSGNRVFTAYLGPNETENLYMMFFFIMELRPNSG